jgi:hypothetical protein
MSYTEPTFCTDCHEPTSLCQCSEPVAQPSYAELKGRLDAAEQLLADIDEYGKIDAWDMSEIRARIGALLYRRTDRENASE